MSNNSFSKSFFDTLTYPFGRVKFASGSKNKTAASDEAAYATTIPDNKKLNNMIFPRLVVKKTFSSAMSSDFLKEENILFL